MAKQSINLGTAPTGTGGDTPRTAFQKAIDNFTELYNAIGAAADGTLPSALPIAKGGTGVANMAALVSALQSAGSYAKGNIVGTVSQASGVPTGAIVETGTTVNGTYTKFADGTMICSRTVNYGLTANTVWGAVYITPSQGPQSMPASFVGIPKIGMTLEANAGYQITGWLLANGASNTTVNAWPGFYIADVAARPITSYNVHFTAFGRWFP